MEGLKALRWALKKTNPAFPRKMHYRLLDVCLREPTNALAALDEHYWKGYHRAVEEINASMRRKIRKLERGKG